MKCKLLASFSVMALTYDVAAAQSISAFWGDWKVTRVVGGAEVHKATDNDRAPLGTIVHWTPTQITDVDGNCKLPNGKVTVVPNDTLEHDVWGNQPIVSLMLSKTLIAKAFGKAQTPMFDDGDKGCAEAVMLNQNQLLLMFRNRYLYLLDRKSG